MCLANSLSNCWPESLFNLSYVAFCSALTDSGGVIPISCATDLALSRFWLWSLSNICPNCFTLSSVPFCWASCPIWTSAISPCIACFKNESSALLLLLFCACKPLKASTLASASTAIPIGFLLMDHLGCVQLSQLAKRLIKENEGRLFLWFRDRRIGPILILALSISPSVRSAP